MKLDSGRFAASQLVVLPRTSFCCFSRHHRIQCKCLSKRVKVWFFSTTATPKIATHMTAKVCCPPGMADCCKWLQEQGLDLGTTNNQGAEISRASFVVATSLPPNEHQGHNALHKAAYGGHAALCSWLQECPKTVRIHVPPILKDN